MLVVRCVIAGSISTGQGAIDTCRRYFFWQEERFVRFTMQSGPGGESSAGTKKVDISRYRAYKNDDATVG